MAIFQKSPPFPRPIILGIHVVSFRGCAQIVATLIFLSMASWNWKSLSQQPKLADENGQAGIWGFLFLGCQPLPGEKLVPATSNLSLI